MAPNAPITGGPPVRSPSGPPQMPPLSASAPLIPPVAPAARPVPGIAPILPAVAPPMAAAASAPLAAGGQLDAEQLARLEILVQTMDSLDYFELLGIEPTASPAEIKKSFYKGSRTFHPDRFFQMPDGPLKEHVNAVYMRLTEAYAVLKEDQKRGKYIGDVSGPERAQKLRFTEASETEAKQQKKKEQEEQIGTTPKGRQFYQTGVTDFDAGRFGAAERNLKMALTYEPGNQKYKEKFKEAQDKVLEEQRKSGSSFKIK